MKYFLKISLQSSFNHFSLKNLKNKNVYYEIHFNFNYQPFIPGHQRSKYNYSKATAYTCSLNHIDGYNAQETQGAFARRCWVSVLNSLQYCGLLIRFLSTFLLCTRELKSAGRVQSWAILRYSHWIHLVHSIVINLTIKVNILLYFGRLCDMSIGNCVVVVFL